MKDRSKSEDGSIGVVEMLAWVAGLSAFGGLIAEVVRRSSRDSAAGLVGGLLVFYVVYVAFSVRAFWKMPRIAIPTTLLIGGALWTLELHWINRSDVARGLIATVLIPLATAYSLRLIFPDAGDREGTELGPARSSLAHSLLDRGVRFGSRSDPSS